jgi:hypothetical protein
MTKVITAEQIMTAQFWTKVEGEREKVRTFALIPDEFDGEPATRRPSVLLVRL